MRMSGFNGIVPPATGMSAAYPSTDLQALRDATDPVLAEPRLTQTGRYSIERTFRPYVYGASDLSLRPRV